MVYAYLFKEALSLGLCPKIICVVVVTKFYPPPSKRLLSLCLVPVHVLQVNTLRSSSHTDLHQATAGLMLATAKAAGGSSCGLQALQQPKASLSALGDAARAADHQPVLLVQRLYCWGRQEGHPGTVHPLPAVPHLAARPSTWTAS